MPLTDAGEVLLLRQYRYAAGELLWEIPAGTLEPGEAPERCAGRELEEEAGVRARRAHRPRSMVPVPGYSTERIWLYAARGLQATQQRLERDELITG